MKSFVPVSSPINMLKKKSTFTFSDSTTGLGAISPTIYADVS